MMSSATMIPSCSSMSRKAMTNCAQADMKRGFLVQIFFLLPARIRAIRLVWIGKQIKWFCFFVFMLASLKSAVHNTAHLR